MTDRTEIKLLLRKFVQNRCSPSEIGILVAYFKESTSGDELPTVEEVTLLLDEIETMDSSEAERIFDSIITSEEKKGRRSRGFSAKRIPVIRYAAVMVVLIGLASVLYFQQSGNRMQGTIEDTLNAATRSEVPAEAITLQLPNGQIEILSENQALEVRDAKGNVVGKQTGNQLVYDDKTDVGELTYNKLTVPFGKKFELFLSDGTRAYLNAGTSIKYPVKFLKGQERMVFLTGEAFFEVAEDTEHPFIIKADELNIRV